MKKFLLIAVAAAVGFMGVAETAPQASAREVAQVRTLQDVRAGALAEMQAGSLQEVYYYGRRHRRYGYRPYYGRRHYGYRPRRYYYGRRYYHRRYYRRPGIRFGIY